MNRRTKIALFIVNAVMWITGGIEFDVKKKAELKIRVWSGLIFAVSLGIIITSFYLGLEVDKRFLIVFGSTIFITMLSFDAFRGLLTSPNPIYWDLLSEQQQKDIGIILPYGIFPVALGSFYTPVRKETKHSSDDSNSNAND